MTRIANFWFSDVISSGNTPLIISIPSPIVKAAKYKKGEKIQIYTDGKELI
jgi:hypothetical protein